MALVACCCWEPWLARKTASESCCWLVAAGGNSGWPGQTRLGNSACCLLLLGTLDSQKNCCGKLLLVGSCWWWILVDQEKIGLGMPLVGVEVEWPEKKGGLGRPKFGWGVGRLKYGWGASTACLGLLSVNHWVRHLRMGLVDRKSADVPPLPVWGCRLWTTVSTSQGGLINPKLGVDSSTP